MAPSEAGAGWRAGPYHGSRAARDGGVPPDGRPAVATPGVPGTRRPLNDEGDSRSDPPTRRLRQRDGATRPDGASAPANATAAPGRAERRESVRAHMRELYFGDGRASRRFRYGLLAFDVVTISFFVVTTVVDVDDAWRTADLAIGVILLADVSMRLWISNRPIAFLARWSTVGDIIVLGAVFGAVFVSDLEFLRILRMLRIFRSYHLARELKEQFDWYRRNEDIVQSANNLFVFIFITTSLVYVVEKDANERINNYLDALYFTITTLTTTGFGDIVATDTAGRVLTVVIMVLGVALFLRLIQTIFRPAKVQYRCPTCGLSRHDPDAVHCKHCGSLVNIPTKGEL